MIAVQLPLYFGPQLTESQKRSVDFLVSARGWPRERAVAYYDNNNRRVAINKAIREAKAKLRKEKQQDD